MLGVSISTASSMDVRGVSMSTASNMDMQLGCILFHRQQYGRAGCITLSTISSMNVQGVPLYRTSGVIFFIDYCTAIRDT